MIVGEACGRTQRLEPPVATGADREQNITSGEREALKQSSGLKLQIHRDKEEKLVLLF